MRCYFCQHSTLQYKRDHSNYLCSRCPYGVHIEFEDDLTGEKWFPHFIWLRLGRIQEYQVVWYFSEGFLQKIRILDDGRFVIDLVDGIENITPINIKNKLSTIFTFL